MNVVLSQALCLLPVSKSDHMLATQMPGQHCEADMEQFDGRDQPGCFVCKEATLGGTINTGALLFCEQ